MVAGLCRPVLRIRTGILLLADESVGQETAVAARLGIGAIDLASFTVSRVEDTRRFLDISRESILRDIDAIASNESQPDSCLLLYNVDLLLSAVPDGVERERFWSFLRTTLKRRRGLVFAVPERAVHLLPEETREEWAADGRLATTKPCEDEHDVIERSGPS
jgi:hypothetical protein